MASLAVGVQSHHFLFLFKCIVYSALCFTSYEFLMEDYISGLYIHQLWRLATVFTPDAQWWSPRNRL